MKLQTFWSFGKCASLALALSCAGLRAQQGAPWKSLPMKLGQIQSPRRLQPEMCLRLFVERGPTATSPVIQALYQLTSGRVVVNDKGLLELDVSGNSGKPVAISRDKPAVVSWFEGGQSRPLLFFYRGRDWWVASAALLSASKRREFELELLDTNADGDFLDPWDGVAWQGGAMRSNSNYLRVDDGESAMEFRLAPRSSGVSLEYSAVAERPAFVDDEQWEAFRAINQLRSKHGCAPAELWEESCAGVKAHTQFLHLNNPDLKGKSPPGNMGEPMDMPHRTDEGHRFGSSGVVATLQSEGQTTAGQVRSTFAMTQSRISLMSSGPGKFGAARTGIWSFARNDAREDRPPASDFMVLPGPGSSGVPAGCLSNWPPPRSFPDLYSAGRGLPISVKLNRMKVGDTQLRVRTIALFKMPELEAAAGFFFSSSDISPGAAETVFYFVPAKPLESGSTYLAQAMIEASWGSGGGGSGMTADHELLQWEFAVGG
jgi:hypothetical protein